MSLAETMDSPLKQSKLTFDGERQLLSTAETDRLIVGILTRSGCPHDIAVDVSAHLIDAELSGVESHGVMRVLQYHEQYQSGYLRGDIKPIISKDEFGHDYIDGQGGIGIPAMSLAISVL